MTAGLKGAFSSPWPFSLLLAGLGPWHDCTCQGPQPAERSEKGYGDEKKSEFAG